MAASLARACRVLGVTPQTPFPEVKKQYRCMVAAHHPDVGGSATMFKDVKTAFEILRDYHEMHGKRDPGGSWTWRDPRETSREWRRDTADSSPNSSAHSESVGADSQNAPKPSVGSFSWCWWDDFGGVTLPFGICLAVLSYIGYAVVYAKMYGIGAARGLLLCGQRHESMEHLQYRQEMTRQNLAAAVSFVFLLRSGWWVHGFLKRRKRQRRGSC